MKLINTSVVIVFSFLLSFH